VLNRTDHVPSGDEIGVERYLRDWTKSALSSTNVSSLVQLPPVISTRRTWPVGPSLEASEAAITGPSWQNAGTIEKVLSFGEMDWARTWDRSLEHRLSRALAGASALGEPEGEPP
jgi:hypothetical protein